MPGKGAATNVNRVPLRKLYAGVVLVLAALVTQDVLLLLWSILGVKVLFTIYIFFTDAADSMFMVGPHPPLMCTIMCTSNMKYPCVVQCLQRCRPDVTRVIGIAVVQLPSSESPTEQPSGHVSLLQALMLVIAAGFW